MRFSSVFALCSAIGIMFMKVVEGLNNTEIPLTQSHRSVRHTYMWIVIAAAVRILFAAAPPGRGRYIAVRWRVETAVRWWSAVSSVAWLGTTSSPILLRSAGAIIASLVSYACFGKLS